MSAPLEPTVGISAPYVRSIPESWSSEWFRRFITNFMEPADVRNAVAGTGINIKPVISGARIKLQQRVQISVNTALISGNPTAKVGLTPVNGSASTVMRSDAAPALDQTISPSWSGIHTFGNPVLIGGGQFGGLANPTTKIGLTAVNGTSTEAMRSDAAQALDQSITPTWTGAHIWSSTLSASGNPLTATSTRVATAIAAVKSSSTNASNNTLTTDSALTLTFNETGYYEVEVWLAFYEASVGTGGFQFNLAGGGTAAYGTVNFSVEGYGNGAIALAPAITSTSTAISATTVVTSSSSPSWFRAKGILQVTTPGTAGVQWAQASTLGADPTTLLAGSYIRAFKVG